MNREVLNGVLVKTPKIQRIVTYSMLAVGIWGLKRLMEHNIKDSYVTLEKTIKHVYGY